MKDDGLYFHHILEAIDRIRSYTSEARAAHPEIPRKDMTGMRD